MYREGGGIPLHARSGGSYGGDQPVRQTAPTKHVTKPPEIPLHRFQRASVHRRLVVRDAALQPVLEAIVLGAGPLE